MFMQSITGSPVTVSLLSGHAVAIPPEGREVPEMFVSEALKTGKVAIVRQVGAEAAQPQAKPEAADPAKLAKIKEAIKTAIEADDGALFTAAGVPDARRLAKVVGSPVSPEDRDQAWAEVQAEADAD